MIAIGWLSLIVLPLAGLAIGIVMDGTQGAIWGALAGLVVAIGISSVMGYALAQAGPRD